MPRLSRLWPTASRPTRRAKPTSASRLPATAAPSRDRPLSLLAVQEAQAQRVQLDESLGVALVIDGVFLEGHMLHRVERVGRLAAFDDDVALRSEEHTSELQSLMRISYAVFCLKKKKTQEY